MPVGSVLAFAGDHNRIPSGWLLCNGAEVSRIDYQELFSIIGTTHGEGNSSSTFNLPDYRGLFLRGVDIGQGIDPDASSRTAMNTGGNSGDKVGSVQNDEFKSHNHPMNTQGNVASGGGYSAYRPGTSGGSGSSGGAETRPKNAYVNYIIKY